MVAIMRGVQGSRRQALVPVVLSLLVALSLPMAGCKKKEAPPVPPPAVTEAPPVPPPEPAQEAPPEPPAPTTRVPGSVGALVSYADQIYVDALEGNWTRARENLREMRGWLEILPLEMKGREADLAEVNPPLLELERVLGESDRDRTLDAANRVHLAASRLEETFENRYPDDVLVLRFKVREVERALVALDAGRAGKAVKDLRVTWEMLRLDLQAKGGTKPAGKFGVQLTRIERARTLAEYSKAIPDLDDEAKRVLRFYRSIGRPGVSQPGGGEDKL